MNRVLNQIKQYSKMASDSVVAKFGTIYSYDSVNHCCKAVVQPEGVESGWLPILSPQVGAGWGVFAPPSKGDVVIILFVEGSFEYGCVVGSLFNDSNRPVDCPSGEFYVLHKSGSGLKFMNDGTVKLMSQGVLSIEASQVNVNCDFNVSGNVSDSKGSMDDMRTTYNLHKHTSATPGNPTSIPDQEMD